MSLRLCTQIKTNGVKCASPALRHHTLCYFHYQWQRRDQRRIRLGGPVGMNKNSGIELPLLDGPEAILVSIMEIQAALLDQRIPIKMGTALLYSLQLALQARIPYSGLCGREPVRECPELELELDMERAKSQRPAKEKCASCSKQETCLSPRNCRKLPKLPTGYRREGDHLVRDTPDIAGAVPHITTESSSRAKVANWFTRAASPGVPSTPAIGVLGWLGALATEVEGPAFSPTEAPALFTTSPTETTSSAETTSSPEIAASAETTNGSLRECSPGRESGVTGRKFPPSRANARRQIDATTTNAISHADNIFGFNPNALLDLGGKFPQLAETKREEN